MSLNESTAHQLSARMRAGEISSREVTTAVLERIEATEPEIGAFISVDAEGALHQAEEIDRRRAAGEKLGRLAGIPLALKDVLCVEGGRTTCGSRILEDFIAPYDATAVARLRQADAVFIGKTNMDEFAMGSSTENSHFGPTRNPRDTERVPGGSSGGSAAAVAADETILALGSDTGGSVRIPSSFCGLVGLKPTYGRISNAGVLPLDRNLDSVGPLARTVEDAALAFQLLAGPDPADPQTWNQPPLQATDDLDEEIAGLRVCFPREFFWEEVDEEVEAAVRASAQTFADLHAHVDEISLEILDDLADLRAGVNLTAVETYLHYRDYLENYPDRFDPIVVPRMMAGKEIKAVDFLRQQIAWADLRRRALRALESVDFLITPTTPFAAPLVDDAEANYAQVNNLCLRNTSAVNLLGLCAISLPCGLTREGLPIGLQLIGRPFDEARLLRLAYAYEQATGCTQQNPDMEAFL